MTDQAHARRGDPDTSHEAARAITPQLTEIQMRVSAYAKRSGAAGFTDAQMEHELDDPGSTLRTRRAELTERNIILDSGMRRSWGDSPRRRIVWRHRDYAVNPPPIAEPEAPPGSPALAPPDKSEAARLAPLLPGIASRLRDLGYSAAAVEIDNAAQLLGRLAA